MMNSVFDLRTLCGTINNGFPHYRFVTIVNNGSTINLGFPLYETHRSLFTKKLLNNRTTGLNESCGCFYSVIYFGDSILVTCI